jgi:hypothetical protein
VACIQPDLSCGEVMCSPRIPDRPGGWRFLLDGFMTRCCSTPSVLEAMQADALALVGPTMVLSETRGLQLSLVMREGIG